ncbi:MAG: hypothetical protein H7256_09195 [Bdellovibrio sp.]|nr:hypothetical protein [Bdellovibrio sp.]
MSTAQFIITCVGEFENFSEIEKVIRSPANKGYFTLDQARSGLEHNHNLPGLFRDNCDETTDTMTAEDWDGIDNHAGFARIVVSVVADNDKIEVMALALVLAGVLLERNLVTAIQCDSSGIAHGRLRWIEMAMKLKVVTRLEIFILLYQAWVRKPLVDDDVNYSSGMQLFGKPDFVTHKEEYEAVQAMEKAFLVAINYPSASPHIKLITPVDPVEIYEPSDARYNKYGYVEINEL